MPRPYFIPTGLPTIHERREREHELQWLFDMDAPRKPRRSREGLTPPTMDQRTKDVFGILPEDE